MKIKFNFRHVTLRNVLIFSLILSFILMTYSGQKFFLSPSSSFDEQDKNTPWKIFLKHRHPLKIQIDDNQPIRLNILVPSLSYELTGGPLNIMRFAVQAAKAGINVRWINLDGNGINFQQLANHLKKYEGLQKFGKLIESNVWHASSLETTPILTNSNDIFMGTLYWTALVASATQKLLKNPNIIYFIQDYECVFFPQSSDLIEVTETYNLPHFAIFSTPMLEDFFREKKLGVYKYNQSLGDYRSFSTSPAINTFLLLNLNENLTNKLGLKRKFIIFARAETPRNAFELTIASISEAIRLKILNPIEWEFLGVGAVNSKSICYLDNRSDLCIKMIQNIPEKEYKKVLAGSEIGLSLTLSPNPSFSVFDFAAAGMIVVTNSFETRTQKSFDKIGENFIVVDSTLNALVQGIAKAILRRDTKPKQIQLNLPKNWNDERCYGNALFNKVKIWFREYSIFPFESFDLNVQ